jgi:hypothetical protein
MVEAIGKFISKSPGCRQRNPGADDGVAATALQRGLIGHFWFDDATSGSLWRIVVAVLHAGGYKR